MLRLFCRSVKVITLSSRPSESRQSCPGASQRSLPVTVVYRTPFSVAYNDQITNNAKIIAATTYHDTGTCAFPVFPEPDPDFAVDPGFACR